MRTPPPTRQRRQEWVPKAGKRKNNLSGGERGGAVEEGAEMVRGSAPGAARGARMPRGPRVQGGS